MNAKLNGRIEFVFSLTVVALILSACSLVSIDSEPVIVQIEATAKAPEIVLPTPTQTEPVATATQTIQPTPTPAIATTEPAPSEVAVEATAGPPLLVDYGDEQTGISFTYPSNWVMEEEANAFIFHNEKVMLQIRYRSAGEQVDICLRTGIPAGDVVILDDQVPFLGQTLTKNSLIYEDRLKAVFYGGHPISVVKSEGMEFTITLDDWESDYLTLNIPDDVLAEAEKILASFAVTSSQDGPSSEFMTYSNPEYGFSLQYPSTWSAVEVNDEAFVAPGSRSLQLGQGTVTLVIGYRRAGEDARISGSGVPAGEFETRGTAFMVDQDVPRQVLAFEDKDKAVFYGGAGTPIAAGGLEFAPRLDNFAQGDYGDIELSQGVQDEADLILSSLVIIGLEG